MARAAMAAPAAATAPGDIAPAAAPLTPPERSTSRSPCAQLALAELAVHAATATVVLEKVRTASSSAWAAVSSVAAYVRVVLN